MLFPWSTLMEKLRIHPKAVCRQLISALEEYKPLSDSDERRIYYAIKNTGIPIDRVLARLSIGAIKQLLEQF